VSGTEGLTEDGLGAPIGIIVEVISGPDRPPALEVAAGTITLGSGSGCDFAINDPSVSQRHVRIELLGSALRVVDLDSTNGTKYLGARISAATVALGAELTLGRSTVRLRARPAEPASVPTQFGAILGQSPAMVRLFGQLEKLARADTNVLIQGETGVGKSAIGRALHLLSRRAAHPFVVFDCGAINPNLIEAALFGHAKGAFTGAGDDRPGVLEQAVEGTLLIDEIGELPLSLQPKLLRALDAREFSRVGESSLRTVGCRFVSATHRNLEEEVGTGAFRRDLFFRVAQTAVTVPPLRERREDVAVLARHFAQQLSRGPFFLSPATIAALQSEPWPGNVRELKNAVERALTLGDFREVSQADRPVDSFADARAEVVRRFERDFLAALIEEHGGNLSAVARAAGLARSHLYRLLERHQLQGK
jgi:two-component system response regulator GlrR